MRHETPTNRGSAREIEGATDDRSGRWRFHRKHWHLIVPGLFVLVILFIAAFGELLVPHDPLETNMAGRFHPPSSEYWLGTDDMGRDVLSRTVAGTRYSVAAAVAVLAIATAIGVLLGLLSGFLGGWVDNLIMRFTDFMFAFPALILAMAIAAILGPSLVNAVWAIGIVWWPHYTRLIRGQVLAVREESYVESARAIGLPEWQVAIRYVLPQCYGVILARVTVDIGYAVLMTATLGFLGLGASPPLPEWGSMIALARSYFFGYWWTAVVPGLAIMVTVLVFSLFGDALHDALDRRST